MSQLADKPPSSEVANTSPVPNGNHTIRRTRSSTMIHIIDERFNNRSAERTALLRQLKKALQGRDVSVQFWACVQVCDLSKLEFLVELAGLSPKAMDIITDLCCTLPYKWIQRPSPFDDLRTISTASASGSQQTSSRSARNGARERDGHKCVITGTRKVYQVAPIFPSHGGSEAVSDDSSAPTIWKFVDVFWNRATAERWHKAAFNALDDFESANGCTNLICLRNDLRAAWANGLFALRPVFVSPDSTEMEVEFHWQPKQFHEPYDHVDVLKVPISSEGVSSVEGLLVVRSTKENGFLPIESGDRFMLRTDDPKSRPLPSYDLLDMQWHLNRIVAMSAAPEIFNEDDDEDEEDDEDDSCTAKPLYRQPPSDVLDWIQYPSSSSSSCDGSIDNNNLYPVVSTVTGGCVGTLAEWMEDLDCSFATRTGSVGLVARPLTDHSRVMRRTVNDDLREP
ncbi:hypothetical protein NUU61_001895 [Penicillium alfredii]|uniref:HNH nuclease domain-containing protein n=1 Tax=Penicillium alfredii TaxID=1506179 RepID=A0A9W9KGC0_9EURO|nr:uncharacterized protein NUU61_001895 [Penicillium alfredii]KAJ5104548.1 hypothetical protein NUU61_001895 [Penicillium alfredii]